MGGFFKSGLTMKNSLIDMLKEPEVNEETERMQREYFEKMKQSENELDK
jgi:glutamate dehydrogenase/leucine dehydrogenase